MNLNLNRKDSEQHGRGTLFKLAAVAESNFPGTGRDRYAWCGQTAGRDFERFLVDSALPEL